MRLEREFLALLDQELPEQTYQGFMEENTRLVPREFVQNHGVHFNLVLRKLGFGADYYSDFVYLSKSSGDWNVVLVEIERPSSKFFQGTTNEFHKDFQKGLQQINRWRAWLTDPTNKASFVDGTLGLVRTPLTRNATYPKFVLVTGRRAEYSKNAIRRSLIAAQEADDFKIMTFDSLVENLESKHDLYVGVRHNEYIDIVSDVFLNESMFAWMPADQIRISSKFRKNALAMRPQWHHQTSTGLAMDAALAGTRMRPTKKK